MVILHFGNKSGPKRLVILSAVYMIFPSDSSQDITPLVDAIADNDGIDLPVSYESLGDPAPNAHKRLHLDYAYDGKAASKNIEDTDVLRITADSH